MKANIALKAQETDQPAAALIRDLKQRDMLKDTLVVWGGEFGRTPMSQGGDGRDPRTAGPGPAAPARQDEGIGGPYGPHSAAPAPLASSPPPEG